MRFLFFFNILITNTLCLSTVCYRSEGITQQKDTGESTEFSQRDAVEQAIAGVRRERRLLAVAENM